jgi:putative DNA primase/helicase
MDTYCKCLCYIPEEKSWYYYDGRVWKKDYKNVMVKQKAKELVNYLKGRSDSDLEAFVGMLTKQSGRMIMISEAESVSPKSIRDFNANPYLINCQNGTFDLYKMQMNPHTPDDFLTMIADVEYVPEAENQRWNEFLSEIMDGDKELIEYLQKILGYALSGITKEECFFIFYGPKTRNGKGTLTETIAHLLGDYSAVMLPTVLTERNTKSNSHSSAIASLSGKRFVTVSELDYRAKLNAARVKELTGGDTVKTRFAYGNHFDLKVQFKLFISTNHLPEEVDDTLFESDRVRLVPFDCQFKADKQDKDLKSKFKEEECKSAIFNWLLRGYGKFILLGLKMPEKSKRLLDEYRNVTDSVGMYVTSETEESKSDFIPTNRLYDGYKKYCRENGCTSVNVQEFVSILRRKYEVVRHSDGNKVKGRKFIEPVKADETTKPDSDE